MAKPEGIINKEFFGLNGILFFMATITALFFELHHYLTSVGIDPRWSGFIIGADSLAMIIIQPILSPFLNNANARRWMIVGVTGTAAALILYSRALTIASLITVRLLQGAGLVCIITGFTVLVVNYIPRELSGRAFAVISIVRLIPYAVVPPFLTGFASKPDDFIFILKWGAVFMMLCFFLLFLIKPPSVYDNSSGRTNRIRLQEFIDYSKQKNILLLFLINLILYYTYTTIFFFCKDMKRWRLALTPVSSSQLQFLR